MAAFEFCRNVYQIGRINAYKIYERNVKAQPYSGWAFSGLLTDGGGGQKGHPLPKICHIYPTMMKLGTVIPYLKKIKKIHESRDTPP